MTKIGDDGKPVPNPKFNEVPGHNIVKHVEAPALEETGSESHAITLGEQKTQLKRETILESLRRGSSRLRACEAAGIGRTSFYKWLNSDLDFAQLVMEAECQAIRLIEQANFAAALDPKNVADRIFFLKCRAGWREGDATALGVGTAGTMVMRYRLITDEEIKEAQRLSTYDEDGEAEE